MYSGNQKKSNTGVLPGISLVWCSTRRTKGMKPATVIGLLLIVLGVIGFAVGGFSFTHEKKDAQIGPVQIEHKSTSTVIDGKQEASNPSPG
jgi:hypothetical protein